MLFKNNNTLINTDYDKDLNHLLLNTKNQNKRKKTLNDLKRLLLMFRRMFFS